MPLHARPETTENIVLPNRLKLSSLIIAMIVGCGFSMHAVPGSSPEDAVIAPDDQAACEQRMMKHFDRNGWVGITPEHGEGGAITVGHVFADSPAERAGVRRGDMIHRVNGHQIPGDEAVMREIYASFRPGSAIIFDLGRNGERLSVEIQPEPIPQSILEEWIDQEC